MLQTKYVNIPKKNILLLYTVCFLTCYSKSIISAEIIYQNETRLIYPQKKLTQCLTTPPQFFIMDGSYSSMRIVTDYDFAVLLNYKDKDQRVQITGISLSSQAKQDMNNNQIASTTGQNKKKYQAILQIYGKCLTSDVTYNEITIPLVVKQKSINSIPINQANSANSINQRKININENQTQKYQFYKNSILNNHAKLQINTIIYCVSNYSILQSNLFIKDLYATFVMFIFGFLLQFKALQSIQLFPRTTHICIYVFASFFMKEWMAVVAFSYAGLFWFACYFKTQQASSYLILMRSIWTISFAISIPTIFGSNMGQKMPQGFTLYLINFCMIANNVMIVSGLINLKRLRHVFYYMIVLGLFQYFGSSLTQNNYVFQLMYPKVIPINCNTQSIFFIIMIIPVCDYFFQSYSPRRLLKFFIMIIPLLSPIKISVVFVCFIICGIWFIFQSIKMDSCLKLIKFRK